MVVVDIERKGSDPEVDRGRAWSRRPGVSRGRHSRAGWPAPRAAWRAGESGHLVSGRFDASMRVVEDGSDRTDDHAPAGGGPLGGGRDHAAGRTWQPLAGDALLERLRDTGRPRPRTDRDLALRLRAGLEEGLLPAGGPPDALHSPPAPGAVSSSGDVPPAPLLVVTKDRLTRVLACEAHYVATEFGERPLSVPMACGAIVDALFRQLVTVGSIGDPMADGLAALVVDGDQDDLVSWIERLPGSARDELRLEVERQAEGLQQRWPALDPSWLPRTQESMRVRLAGGTIELSARADLTIGRPAGDEGSVAIVEIKSGARRIEHRADLHFYALLETLRSPAPPFVVATYYTRTGELDVEPITDELLMGAARRTLIGARRLVGLAAGSDPGRTPGWLCGRCSVLPECGIGRAHVERLAGFGSDGEEAEPDEAADADDAADEGGR